MAQLKDLLVAGNARIIGESSFNDNVTVNGDLSATNVSGNGSGLTNLNASNIADGTLAADRLPASGATAGSYGLSSNTTGSHGAGFSIPYITVDAYGRITSISDKTLTLPTDNNTDTKVTQAAAITTNGDYPIILGYSTATTAVTNTVNKTSTLTYNPSTKVLTTNALRLTGEGDSNPGAAAGESVALMTGKASGQHLEFDDNEIASKNGSTAATLHLNYDDSSGKNGGPVLFGSGGVTMKGTLLVKKSITAEGVISTTDATVSTSKTTGALKVSGGAGIAGQMSANTVMVGDEVVMQYDSTLKAMKFVF